MNDNTKNTGTQIPPSGTGTAVPPSGTGTAVPPSGSGTAVPPGAPAGTATVGGTAMIPEYPEYIIGGIRYRVCQAETQKTLAKKSGEAKIFVVENGGRKFVIKLYMPGHSPNHAILDEVQKARGGFMIALHDHGKWADPAHPGLALDYEIMAYAPYGSLADVRLRGDEKRFREVAWRMAFCIKQCHDHGILHRDIKPENFLFTDPERRQFVISDFGIARSIKGSDTVKVDAAKSSYFVSPEGSISSKDRTTWVSRSTDYYSMGMTLLALWIGLDTFYSLFPYDQLEELDRLKLNNRVISEIGDDILGLSAHSRSLLERLLEPGDQNRAGFDDIKRWYEGETLKTGAAAEAATSTSAFNVTFDENKGLVAHSREELAKMMLADVEFAKSFIYRGMAKNALQASFPRLAAEIDDIPQRLYPRPDEQATGVYAACLLLDPTIPFIGKNGNRCASPKDIARELIAHQADYVAELARPTSNLWAFLRMRGDSTTKQFPDKYQPMIARSRAHGLYALCKVLDPSLPLPESVGKGITNAKQLSKVLWQRRGVMATELANPDHTVWTWLASLGPNAAQIARTYPDKIRQGGTSALYSLCLALDSDTGFPGKDGRECRTEAELGRELFDNVDQYQKELSDPNHLFWQYLRRLNDSCRSYADKYPALIKQSANEYIYDLIYRLDPTIHNTLQDGTTKKWVRYNSFAELVKYISEHEVTPLTLRLLSRRDTITWLSLREPKLGATLDHLVQQAGADAKEQGWYFLYMLAPDTGFFLKKGQTATVAQIGERINREMNGLDPKLLVPMLSSTTTFIGSRLHQYMRARKMTAYIDGIKKIIDIKANEKAHPAAPYNIDIAMWKVIAYLGATPSFRLPGQMKPMTTLAEVKVSQASARAKQATALGDFLTVFFHERKGAKFSFSLLRDYYDFLCEYVPSYPGLQQSATVRDRVTDTIGERDSAWRSLKRTRLLTIICCMVPMIFIMVWMIATALTDGSADIQEAFKTIGKWIAIGAAIILGLGAWSESNLLGGIIAGAVTYLITAAIFSWLAPAAPFALAAIVIAVAVWCICKMNVSTKDTVIPDQNTYDSLRDQADMYLVCLAFGTASRTFGGRNADPTDTFRRSRDAAIANRKKVRGGAIAMVISAVVTLVIGLCLMDTVGKIEKGEYATVDVGANVSPYDMVGHWSGTFHNRKAEFDLARDDDGIISGTVKIYYSTPMTQPVSATSDSNGLITLWVNDGSGAKYTGTAKYTESGTIDYVGNYTNPTKGTSHNFNFLKQ